MQDNTLIVIGGGFAGLSAGIYAQMNGYQAQIFEMHSLPGGLCTAWKRKGYTIDGCVHWLVGSSPESGMHRFWQEVGVAQESEFIDMDEYMRYEGEDGRTLILYTNVDRLEEHLLALSPEDAEPIGELTGGIRMCLDLDPPSPADPLLKRLQKGFKYLLKGRQMQTWMQLSAEEFTERFQDPLLSRALREMWFPQFSILFMLFTFAWLHNQNAGYPIGGSLPLSLAMANRYKALGGAIEYGSRVEKILVEDDRAVGVRLADGSEQRAGRVISAADGHATLFEMLDGEYGDECTREPYEEWPLFPPLLYVGIGVNRTFEEQPHTTSGISFPLRQPTEIGSAIRERMELRIFNHDPTLAPEGKTSMTVTLISDYTYWQKLAQDRAAYDEKKDQIARTIVELLDQRFPGISEGVEMVDVATPMTFERYTGNWKGSFEGWLLTPENAFTLMRPMRQTLAGLEKFYMCGQWVEPGGGLPTSVMSGRRLMHKICKEDKKKFETTIA